MKRIAIFLMFLMSIILLSSCQLYYKAEEMIGETIDEIHFHSYSDSWEYDNDTHWHPSTCGHTDLKKDMASHTYGSYEIITYATLTNVGSRKRKCSVCEYEEITTYSHEHNYNDYEMDITPTLTTEGQIKKKCVNDLTHYEYYTLPVLSDSKYQTEILVPATLISNGITKYIFDDGIVHFEFTIDIEATSHNMYQKSVVPATNDSFGYKIYGCSDCDYEFRGGLTHKLENLYGYNYFKNTNSYLASIYEEINEKCVEFKDNYNDISPTSRVVSGDTIDTYTIATINFSNVTSSEAVSVWSIFCMENPWYYWLDNQILYTSSMLIININEEYAKGNDRLYCDNSLMLFESEAYANIDTTKTQKYIAKDIHDFLANKIDYAYVYEGSSKYPSSEIWAHNIIGATKGEGVCECYSKSFYYLSALYGIECIMVSGKSKGEGHSWNYINIDDNWYGVDVTWDDQSSGIIYNYFGASNLTMSVSHTPDNTTGVGISFLYTLPTLSNTKL